MSPGNVGASAPPARALPPRLLTLLACPACGRALDEELGCATCGVRYETARGVLDLRPPGSGERSDAQAWEAHWSAGRQRSAAQRFFSFYRKVVFARTVAHFIGRYFPDDGVLVEAGSGTSETSMRIRKAPAQTLVAVDLVPAVLERCHPIMDVRIAGDILRLPFADGSVAGIWNVGVMEHLDRATIDAVLAELLRVLRPGGRLLLLWPGTNSAPQKLLRLIERVVNARHSGPRFRFHPDEISQLHSVEEGRAMLARKGLALVAADAGLRSLFAFKVLVAEKENRP